MDPHHPAPTPSLAPGNAARGRWVVLRCSLLLFCLNTPAAPVPGLPVLQRVRVWSLIDGLPDNRIKSIVRTRAGDLWFGTRDGLVRFHGDAMSVYTLTNAPALRNPEVSRMVEDSQGGLWLGTPSGVVRWRDERFERLDPTGRLDFSINVMLPDTRSGDWIGGNIGLANFRDGTWKLYGKESGLRDVDVNSLAEHPDGSLWIGCHQGLIVYDPSTDGFQPVDLPGPHENFHVQAIAFTPQGSAWVLTGTIGENHCRLWHGADNRWEDCTGRDNRMGDQTLLASFSQPGQFWNVSARWGLQRWVEPTSLEIIPPPPSLRDIAWSLCDDGLGNLWIGTGAGGLELWRTSDNSAAIPFSNIRQPPTRPHSNIPVLAATLIGIAALVAAAIYHRHRLARLQERSRRQLAAEQQRIASRLHDHIGSEVTELTLLAQRLDQEGSLAAVSSDSQQSFSRSAQQLSQALRESLWELQSTDSTVDGLLNHLGDQAHSFLQAAGIRCRLAFPDEPLDIPLEPRVRQEVFLAAKEALHNVVRHAAATEVRLHAALRGKQLELEIEDDGSGFAMGPTREDTNGLGLPTMHRRLRSVGGACQITSRPGGGTRVLMELPVESTSRN